MARRRGAANLKSMTGLYALKPWYSRRLRRVLEHLAVRRVRPTTVTFAGVGCGAAAGIVIAAVRPGIAAGLAVAVLLAARLACANLDGALARRTEQTTRRGAMANELGDRGAELLALAGCLALAPPLMVAVAALASVLPSWVSLAGVSAGAPRIQGGPVGKTERVALLVLVALTGWVVPLLLTWVGGCLLTAVLRLRAAARALDGTRPIAAGLR
jgi:CDP-diacylglycerol--glycerol-3-phosphate 3-phosphatidyltransferase